MAGASSIVLKAFDQFEQHLASATIIANFFIEVCKNMALPFGLVSAFCIAFVLALPFALAIICLYVLLALLGLVDNAFSSLRGYRRSKYTPNHLRH